MIQLAQERLHGETTSHVATPRRPRLRPGLVFVPCPLCSSPVDLALLGGDGQVGPCARHRPVLTCIRGSRDTAEV
jgi:hypothetical protein